MDGKMDQIKGRIKEAAGALTDDDRLKREGQLDQVAGKVKETAAKVAESLRGRTALGEENSGEGGGYNEGP
jgi:uncharacterized protein YjbJ (UPF0337 family)